MANKKIRMRPEGTNDYADVLHPETTASVVIEETDKRFMTDAERTKLAGIEVGANNYTHPATHSADMITDGTTNKVYTSAEKTKLSGIATNANNYSHPTTHPASIIVQDTNNRFVTDAEKSAWNGKQNALGYTPLNSTLKGAVSGIAELDANGRVPSSQLPSYVDDVLEYTSKSNFPVTGESGKIYISSDTNLTYRWSGTAYVEISASLALGETSSTAFFGDKGKVAYNHSQTAHAPSNATANDTDANLRDRSTHTGTQSADTITDGTNNKVFTSAEKTKLSGIATNANNYSHPTTHPASMITESSTKRFVSDTEKSSWNSKAEISDIPTKVGQLQNDKNYVTQSDLGQAGLGDMTKGVYDTNNNGVVDNAEKVNGFTVGINVPSDAKFTDTVYTHPASHPASMIVESTIKRFVSDAEKAEWNSKSIKNIGTFSSHEELIMYAVTEQIPTGQYAFFMGDAGHASLVLVRDAGTYYEGIAQGSDGLFVIFDVTKQGQMREYDVFDARDIIASFDDIRSIFSELDDKVDNSRVLTDVPANAKFTDTVYTHPASHPASMITESTTRRFVSDVEKSTWNSKPDTDTITTINGKTGAITKEDITALGIPAQDTVVDISGKADTTYVDSKVQTDVPSGAKFTDTITTINGKTGAIEKEDIVALGLPAQDTTYSIATTSANGLMSSTDKQNLNANTTSRHTHINKAVIDKFSEVDNKPYYDGVEIGGGSIVDLGTFNNETELITHVLMNQLPGGHYTFIVGIASCFMLLGRGQNTYYGTLHDSNAIFYYFEVSFYGEILELKEIDLKDLELLGMGIENLDMLKADISYVDEQDALKADKTYVDNKIKTDVPVGAKFTDTITTINGKTGAISKADIVALGIPAQDTVYTHPGSGTNPHGTTKSDVGLGNVTNDKQMPISGGVLENYTEKLTTVSASGGSINLSLGNVFQHTPSGNITYSISNAVNGQAHSFTLIIDMGSTVRTLTFPASVKWQGGEIPDLTTANKTYVLTFMTVDGGTNWLGMFGGEF